MFRYITLQLKSELIFAEETTMETEYSEDTRILPRQNLHRSTVHDATSNGVAGSNGHNFQPSQYGTMNGIQRRESTNDDPLCNSVSSCLPILKVYRRRWWILLVYSLLAFM